jgi:hypothetical protein
MISFQRQSSPQNKLTRRRKLDPKPPVGKRLGDYVVSTHPLALSLREISHWLCTLTRLAKNHVKRRINARNESDLCTTSQNRVTRSDAGLCRARLTGREGRKPSCATGVATGRLIGVLQCGNNGPNVGITSTPVIDLEKGEIFVMAYLNGSTPCYQLHALDLATLADAMGSVTGLRRGL